MVNAIPQHVSLIKEMQVWLACGNLTRFLNRKSEARALVSSEQNALNSRVTIFFVYPIVRYKVLVTPENGSRLVFLSDFVLLRGIDPS
jgi:hypothetical protein